MPSPCAPASGSRWRRITRASTGRRAYSCLITIAHVGCGTTTSRPAAAERDDVAGALPSAKCSRSPLCNHGAPQHVVSSTSVQLDPVALVDLDEVVPDRRVLVLDEARRKDGDRSLRPRDPDLRAALEPRREAHLANGATRRTAETPRSARRSPGARPIGASPRPPRRPATTTWPAARSVRCGRAPEWSRRGARRPHRWPGASPGRAPSTGGCRPARRRRAGTRPGTAGSGCTCRRGRPAEPASAGRRHGPRDARSRRTASGTRRTGRCSDDSRSRR